MSTFILYVLIGGGIGATIGYFNKCNSGACALTSNWWRGAIYGAVLAGSFCFATGCGGNSAAMNQSTANVKHITDAEFAAEVNQSSQPVVVDCYATWCGPCKQLSPIVDALADEYAGKIKFVKVNVDESPKTAQQFQVSAIPTLLFFKDGKLASSSVGLLSKTQLAVKLEALISPTATPIHDGR